jgi:hypothetical protein
MKACFKCNRCLPLTEFYKHPMMGDGHLGKCKECARLDVRANREKRRDYYLEYDRRRSRTPERRAGIRLSQVKWSDRQRARVLLHNAIARGKIVKPKECETCGEETKLDGHHPDYAKPLDVMWLCRRCHMKHHRMTA